MIINPTESMNQLKNFFIDTLPDNKLEIPDLVSIDTLTNQSYWNPLVINNPNIEEINFPNLIQSPLIIKGENLRRVNLESLSRTEFGVSSLDNYSFLPLSILQNTKIQTLNLPNFIGTGAEVPPSGMQISESNQMSFLNNYWLKTVFMGNSFMKQSDYPNFIFNGFWFRNNYSLVALCLNYPYVIPLDRTEGFNTTPIKKGNGHIYVPENLLEEYRAADYWKIFPAEKFKSLNEYENNMQSYFSDTIQDSWQQIIANCNNNSYGNYQVGDTKTLYWNGIPIQMVIVGKNKDTNSENEVVALTWMMKTISIFNRYNLGSIFNNSPINFANANGTESYPGYRKLFTETIYNGISSNPITKDNVIINGIKPVVKHSVGTNNSGVITNTLRSIETIWPPSASELNLRDYTTPYSYFTTLPTIAEAEKRPNYSLGLTTLVTDETNKFITVGTRDYSTSSTTPDLLRATGENSKMELIQGDNTNSYIIFGFCT